MRDFEKVWAAYEKYKETAEQADFFKLFMMDTRVKPYYNNLVQEYTPEHEKIFCDIMRDKVFPIFGIREEE